jgi:hypothetical protein
MASLHKGLRIYVLYKDSANSSDCLVSNVWLMFDELMMGRKCNGCIISFGYKPEGSGFDSRFVFGIFL